MKKAQLTNAVMAECVTLRSDKKKLGARITELEKTLSRAAREIETLQAQLGDNGSRYLLDKIQSVLINQAP